MPTARIILSTLQKEHEIDEGVEAVKLGFNKPTTNTKELIKLLRTLDGSASGAENIEIGNKLLPHKPQSVESHYNRSKTAPNLIKSAKRISELRYRLIPFR